MTSSRGLRAQVESLLADELWDSAETLGGLLASHAQSRHADAEGVPAGERAACVALFADALLGKREHRRALHHYARALELNRLAPPAGGQTEAETPTPMGTRPPGTPGPDGSPAAPAPVTPGGAAALAMQETPATSSGAARSGAVPDATHLDESSTKFKMGKCFAALREWRFALAELETIPARARTLPVTLALAEAYKRTGYDRASIACYKECLRINPFAVEAVEALADAGAAPAEPDATEKSGGADDASLDALATETLRRLTRGRLALASGDAATAASVYAALAETFPGDARVELARARAASAAGDADAAADAFRRRRASDPRAVEGADEFAELLRVRAEEGEDPPDGDAGRGSGASLASSAHDADDEHGLGGYGVLSCAYGLGGGTSSRGASGELRALVSEALEAAPERPESWGAAATYWAARGQVARALGYADKALRLDDRRVAAHVARGHLCLRLRRPEDAVGSFRRAAALCASATSPGSWKETLSKETSVTSVTSGPPGTKDAALASRAGLVAGYLLQRRRKEALAAAKEALAMAPESALARALVGDAYLARGAQNAPSGGASASADFKARAEKAKKHFESALALRPFDSRLALALSEAQRACGESDAAIQTLRVHLETYASAETRARVACHCALGAALASARMLADAAGEYQRACGLDAECEPAKRGLARVERLMKGQDPDARDDVDEDEDDGGGDEDDDEGDEEEDEGDLFE